MKWTEVLLGGNEEEIELSYLIVQLLWQNTIFVKDDYLCASSHPEFTSTLLALVKIVAQVVFPLMSQFMKIANIVMAEVLFINIFKCLSHIF